MWFPLKNLYFAYDYSHLGIIITLIREIFHYSATCNNYAVILYHVFTLLLKSVLNFLVPSYIISCYNCGHGTDLRGCPQAPLSIEGMRSLYQLTCSQYPFRVSDSIHRDKFMGFQMG